MPNNSQEPFDWKGYLRFFLPPLIFLLIGTLLILYVAKDKSGKEETYWDAFFLELGLGFQVGCVISLTIETYMRFREKKEDVAREERVNRNIFEALFRTALPPELVQEMYAALFNPKFVREDLRVTYTFSPLIKKEGKPDFVQDLLVLQQIVSYTARNVIDKTAKHSVRSKEYLLLEYPGFDSPFKQFHMRGSDARAAIHLTGNEIREVVMNYSAHEKDKIWYTLGERTVEVLPGECAEVRTVVEKVCRYADTKTWITKTAAKNLTLSVVVTDEKLYEELEFSVDQSHRQDLTLKPHDPKNPMSYEWSLDYPILPNQGIILHWRPRRLAEQA
jgi:hypothetical protein